MSNRSVDAHSGDVWAVRQRRWRRELGGAPRRHPRTSARVQRRPGEAGTRGDAGVTANAQSGVCTACRHKTRAHRSKSRLRMTVVLGATDATCVCSRFGFAFGRAASSQLSMGDNRVGCSGSGGGSASTALGDRQVARLRRTEEGAPTAGQRHRLL